MPLPEQLVAPLKFHEGSVVPEGDNPGALILIAKQKGTQMPTKPVVKADPAPAAAPDPMAGFSDEQKAAVQALMADAVKKAVADCKAEYDAASAPPPPAAGADDGGDSGDDSKKPMPPQFAKMAAKVAAYEKELAEHKAKLAEERDARLTREYSERAKKYDALPAKTSDVAKVLRAIDEKAPEVAKQLTQVLDACSEAAKMGVGVLASRHGRSAEGDGQDLNPEAVIEAKAKELQAKNPKLEYVDAYRMALRQSPAAYAAIKAKEKLVG